MAEARNTSESDEAATPDAVDGRAKVEARMAQFTPEEQAAVWEEDGQCFGSGKPPEMKTAAG